MKYRGILEVQYQRNRGMFRKHNLSPQVEFSQINHGTEQTVQRNKLLLLACYIIYIADLKKLIKWSSVIIF